MYNFLSKKMRKNKKGFTLIELIVVIAILGILAAVIIPRFSGFQDKARGTQVLTEAKQIATAIDTMQTESLTGAWPLATDKTAILTLAGVDPTDLTFVLGAGGAFSISRTIASKVHTAGRLSTLSGSTYTPGSVVKDPGTITPLT